GVTKYAAGDTASSAIPARGRRVLVPGQVEDDLSVRLGGAGVCSNLDLLRRVRRAEPDAWIAYRPHPDVTAGLRKGHVSTAEALSYADAILIEGSMAGLLERVDCVHVLTS
ncbi:beta-3-deoxy-D-manno-oct-2-ulosonic acid transferase, partial [Bacilli bacterium]